MPRLECEVLVIGARIAGATLASLLGQAGRSVLLVDRASFPSPTLSTHFFRGAWAVGVLDRLGVIDDVLALGPPRLIVEYNYADGAALPTVDPPQDPGAMGFNLSVRRERLDDILVRRAKRESGVTVLEGTRFVEVRRDGESDRIVGAILDRDGERLEVRSRFSIGADGRHSAFAAAVAAADDISDPPMRALYYQYVRGFPGPGGGPPDGPEFSMLGDEIAYAFPSDDGVTCIAVSVNRERFLAMRSAVASTFPAVIATHPGLAERFAGAEPVDRVLGCGPERSYIRIPVGPGWALVGDASIHQDPWTGSGIDFAATHATFLSDALLEILEGGAPEADGMRTYRSRRDDHGLAGYRFTTDLAKDLRRIPN